MRAATSLRGWTALGSQTPDPVLQPAGENLRRFKKFF